ncbi:hypothetical protein BD310DRAFT_228957 [Dichomitus squalens]|uniref:Uncharacterized protein n=1 Tax=Dichomitus squalens TaxID=114155 RepID=A0A4Q9PCL5_9APHY|nr:hypothetical protein BD310DRAFT_228957 [Dichomitus squalens]
MTIPRLTPLFCPRTFSSQLGALHDCLSLPFGCGTMSILHLRSFFFAICVFLTVNVSTAILVNRTIDDQAGDAVTGLVPQYSPASAWSQGSTCPTCLAKLDPSQTFDSTWHDGLCDLDGTGPCTATIQFTGTAVYVYNVLANRVSDTASPPTNLTFWLDGTQVGTFVHTSTTSTAFNYNALTFSSTALENVAHTLVMRSTTDLPSMILFDYVVYTTDDDSVSDSASFPSSSSTSTPPSTSITNKVFASERTDLGQWVGITSTAAAVPSPSGDASTLAPQQSGSSEASFPFTVTSPSTQDANPQPSAASSQSTSATSNTPTVPLGAVIGGAVGGTLVLVVFVVVIFVSRRRRRSHIDPFPLELEADNEPLPRDRGAETTQNSVSTIDQKVRAPNRKRSYTASQSPLLHSGTESQSYDRTLSASSFHCATVSDMKRTMSRAGDTISVVGSERAWDPRPLPIPTPPVPPIPRPQRDSLSVATQNVRRGPSLYSAATTTPISPLDIDISDLGDYYTPAPSFGPARRDSQIEPARSIRRLPSPPIPQPRAPASVPTPAPAPAPVTPITALEAFGLDLNERPDSPSIRMMYAELQALQKQVARLKEGGPFGEAPPDYAESVIGSIYV